MALDYPKAALKSALELAAQVDSLGGNIDIDACAKSMNRTHSGAFKDLIAGSAKYDLVHRKKGNIATTSLFDEYRLSVNEEEKKKVLQKAFLKIPLFQKVHKHFIGKSLPDPKILVVTLEKNFSVDRKHASQVSGYIHKGMSMCNLISNNGKVLESDFEKVTDTDKKDNNEQTENLPFENGSTTLTNLKNTSNTYSVQFRGPDMDATHYINDEDDFVIINALLSKLRKKILIKKSQDETD